MRGFEIISRLDADADDVWRFVTSPEGINEELSPWLRMTMPGPMRGRGVADVPVGVPLGRSWLLLFGVLPVEYDAISLDSLEPGAFRERSSMATLRSWRHDRRVRPCEGGCEVTDRLGWQARLPGSGGVAAQIVAALFRHRHRRLRARFGGEILRAEALDSYGLET